MVRLTAAIMSIVKDSPADMVIAMNKNMQFTVKECSDTGIIKDLFVEYSHIKGSVIPIIVNPFSSRILVSVFNISAQT